MKVDKPLKKKSNLSKIHNLKATSYSANDSCNEARINNSVFLCQLFNTRNAHNFQFSRIVSKAREKLT